MATRWGIAGAGKISSDFVSALSFLPKTQHEVVAIAARSQSRAEEFAQKFGIPNAYSSYSNLVTDANIDVVYIGVISNFHFELAKELICASKNVLCEKPLCMDVKETEALLDLARKHKVFLMEAVWSRCFPLYKDIMSIIESNEIGDIVHVMATFGQKSTVERSWKKELGASVLLDLGIYCIQLASLVMNEEMPVKITAVGTLSEEGVDESASISLLYSGGRMATLVASIKADYPCEAHIIGTKGSIKINHPFWCPTSFIGPSGEHKSPLPQTGKFHFVNSQGLMHEAVEVRRCLREGLTQCPYITLDETMRLARIMEEARKQLGVRFED